MILVDLVQGTKSQTTGRLRDVLAERPPEALCTFDSPLASPIGAFRIDVNRVDARPSDRATLNIFGNGGEAKAATGLIHTTCRA